MIQPSRMPARIAIVGAGVAGLSSALYLHRLGHAVTVFERFPAARPVGSGLMLQPTGMSVLHDLGLLERVLALGQRIVGLVGHDARSGRQVLDVSYRCGRFGLGVNRAALFQVLFDAVRAAEIPIETGCEITGTEASGGLVKLAGGDAAGEALALGPLAGELAADGADLALQVAHARLVGVLAHDMLQRVVGESGRRVGQPVQCTVHGIAFRPERMQYEPVHLVQ